MFFQRNHTLFLQTAHHRVLDRGAGMFIDDRHDLGDRLVSHAAHVVASQILSDWIDVIHAPFSIRRNDAVTN